MGTEPNEKMAGEIRKFFNKSIPRRTGGNAIVFGDDHLFSQHILYLKQHIALLRESNNLGTIGVELPPYMNVVFWAYRDGTLAQKMGCQEAARDYVTRLCVQNGNPLYDKGQADLAALVTAALDEGIDVVAYDARHQLSVQSEQKRPAREHNHALLCHLARQEKSGALRIKMDMRSGARPLPNDMDPYAWVLTEINQLCDEHPHYRERLEKIEKIVAIGEEKKLRTDALSATLFTAAANPEKNAILLTGVHHMDGKGIKDPHQKHGADGTLPDHMEFIDAGTEGVRWNVQCAVLGTAAVTNRLKRSFHYDKLSSLPNLSYDPVQHKLGNARARLMGDEEKNREEFEAAHAYKTHEPVARERATMRVEIDRGTAKPIPLPSPEQASPLAVRFMEPWSWNDAALVHQRVKPLLIPAIREAYNAVRADWHPELAEQKER